MDQFADALTLIKQFGPFFLAVVFFLWRDYRREDRLSTRIDVLEDEQRAVILPLVQDCTAVVAKNTVVMERLEKYLEKHS
jgi:cbb3-type cytochrome oxidase subunit 3